MRRNEDFFLNQLAKHPHITHRGTLNLDSGMKDHVGSIRQAKMLPAAREPRRGEIDLWMKELTALSAERKWSRDGYRTRRMEDSLALAGTLAIL